MGASATFTDRVLAEAVRTQEESQGYLYTDDTSVSKIGSATTDLETRVALRAKLVPGSERLRAGVQALHRGLLFASTIAVVIAVLAGSGTATAAFGTGGGANVNVYVALTAILGVNLLALGAWLVLIAFRPAADATTSLGGLVWLIARRVAGWLGSGHAESTAALKALAVSATRSGAARWGLSAISHGFWAAFIVGAIVASIFLLGTRQYVFIWETTILSAETFVPLTQSIASIPGALGFSAPDLGEIESSQWTGDPNLMARSAADAWSGFLIGAIIVYGLLPRLVLLVTCIARAVHATRRYRLDLNLPAFAMVAKRLEPAALRLGVSDPDTEANAGLEAAPQPVTVRPRTLEHGPPAVLGLEIERPASGWPPLASTTKWLDLGIVDSREQRQTAIGRLDAALPPPSEVVVVCSMATTPDRGSERFLAALTNGRPGAVLLTAGDRLRQTGGGDSVARRAVDWRSAVAHAGIPSQRVLEIDLEHMTEISARRLQGFLSKSSQALPENRIPSPHFAPALAKIGEAVKTWNTRPDAIAQAELHRQIARLYRGRDLGWRELLNTDHAPVTEPLALLERGADRMISLLPERLRSNSSWIASGATAGALACVAAATLAAPAALAALPLWAGMGGALSLVLKERLRDTETESARKAPGIDSGEAVRAAALFTVLLELQGRDEPEITRIIDQVFDVDTPELRASAEVTAWLESVGQRLRTAAGAST